MEWVQTDQGWQVYAKQYLNSDATKPPETLWLHQEVGHNHSAAEELKKLFDGKVFDSPKPKELIANMRKVSTFCDNEDIILDFFSGSATTAHAVMQLNAEDGGNRRFILVQLPEVCDEKSEAYKAGYKNICEIGKERIRRAGKKIQEENDKRKQIPMLKTDDEVNLFLAASQAKGSSGVEQVKPLFDMVDESFSLDTGFKVFKLDTSNLKTWDATPIEDEQLDFLYERMNAMVHRVKPERSDLDMVYEIMLKLGVPLTYSVHGIDVNDKTAYAVGDDYLLLVCLAENVQPEDVEQMTEYAPAKVIISRDSFADDTAMANAYYILRDHQIELKLV